GIENRNATPKDIQVAKINAQAVADHLKSVGVAARTTILGGVDLSADPRSGVVVKVVPPRPTSR
ncbi:MAG: hypothetical protein ABIT69_03035, partial [Sphingomicrobium sp.]